MPSSKGTSGIAVRHPNHSPGNDYDLGGQWVSNAMPARSWTTADTFEFAMMFKDGNNPPTTFITHLSIRVFNAAGDTEVGVLFEGEVNASAWISSFRSRHCDGIALQNSVNMPEYGHLVVEIGGYATYDATYGGDMLVGEGTSTALPLNDTETNTDLYPWIAFTYGGAGGYTLACDGGSYSLTGTALTPKRDGKIVPEAGSYALTGQAAGVYYGHATKIYLPSSGAAPVTPSTWNHANQAATTYTLPGVLAKGTTALTSRTTATGTTSPYTRAVMRYVIGPLAATEIAGTVNAVMRCSESTTGANATMSIAVKIITPGGADRAVLLAATASDLLSGVQEFSTSLYGRRAWNVSEVRPIPLTAQTPTAGDYLVIELGFRSATTTTRDVVMRHGDNAANDMVDEDGSNLNDYAPWVEFSANIGWPTAYTLACDGGSYGLTGQVMTPKRDGQIVSGAGSYSLAGQDAGVYYGRAIDADGGSYAITGSNASLLRAALLALGSGAYALTGSDAAVLLGRLLSTEAGTYVLTGAAIAALYGRAIDADAGAYVITGQDAALLRAARLAVEAGTYVLTGQDVTLTYVPGAGAYILSCSSGTYAIVGGDAGLRRDARIAPEAGTYTLTGQAAATLLGRLVNAGAGAYVLTGQDVTLTYVPGVGAYLLSCEGGTYATAGSNLNLIYSGEAGVLKRWTGTAWVNVNVIVLYGG